MFYPMFEPNLKFIDTCNNEKFRSKNKKNIHKKEAGPYQGFGY